MQCQVCNQEVLLPFRCPFCGGQFCSAHRLPENHACPRIDFARSQSQEQVLTPQTYSSYQYSYNIGAPKRAKRLNTSPKELKHITVAALLIVAIGFSIGLYGNYTKAWEINNSPYSWTWAMMSVFAVILAVSMLTHEYAHKIMAQRSGMWAEFRLTTWGTVLTFICIFLPIRMIAPGAMMIAGTPNGEEIVKISLVGPTTNMIFSGAFLAVAFSPIPTIWSLLFFFAAYINAFMAIFNLIPFGILDGYKIFSMSKKVWAIAFSISIVLTAITLIYGHIL
jgi:Zn-dependent protease